MNTALRNVSCVEAYARGIRSMFFIFVSTLKTTVVLTCRHVVAQARRRIRLARQAAIDRARRLALNILRDHDDADEAVAQTLFRMHKGRRTPDRFESYLLRAVQNAALDIVRWRRRCPRRFVDIVSIAEGLEDQSPSPAQQCHGGEMRAAVQSALAALPSK